MRKDIHGEGEKKKNLDIEGEGNPTLKKTEEYKSDIRLAAHLRVISRGTQRPEKKKEIGGTRLVNA